MKSTLRILHLEDNLRDAELVEAILSDDGLACDVVRIENEADFVASLEQGEGFDLIFADYTLPSFDGLSALKVARQKRPDVPFIFISGTMGEEVAIEALKIGATDYVFKTRLSRILPSVHRALREARERNERKGAEEALRRSEAYLAEAERISHTGSFGWKVSTGEIYWSRETFRIFAYEPSDKATIEMALQRTHPEDRPALQQFIDQVSRELKPFELEHRLLMPDGSIKHIRAVGHPSMNNTGDRDFVGAISDVTAARVAEEKIRQDERELRVLVDTIAQLVLFLNPDGRALHANKFTLEYTGLSLEDIKAENFREKIFHPEDVERLREERRQALLRGVPFENEQRARRKDGQYRWFFIRYNALRDEQGRPIRWYAAGIDIEDRKQAEEKIRKENLALRDEIDNSLMFEEIVGGSPALLSVLARVAKVAPTDSTVLITGETGTGKELFARAIHKRSRRSSRAFVSVNCAATPSTLIASELFGHEKGAFTGALQRRLGRFELAEGGTIFLDEIGELPLETQVALLRVLQEREFERVGGSQVFRADVRVIAATNRDLESAIAGGAFRKDLFYRLNVFPIEIPPLRVRREDIPTLVEYFVQRYSRKVGKRIRAIEKRTLELLDSYTWPGNIRELQNVIERSVIFCESDLFSVDPSWFSFESSPSTAEAGPIAKMSQVQQREAIETALAATAGRVSGPSGAAAHLSVPASTLESKIRALKINKYRFKKA
jgi:PAS domain S-box-containing protein